MIGSLVEALATRIEKAHTQEQISRYARNAYRRLSHDLETLEDDAADDVRRAARLLSLDSSTRHPTNADHPDASLEPAMQWLGALGDDPVVVHSVVRKDAGRMLDVIDGSAPEAVRERIRVHLETLMRHVEVKREDCLSRFEPTVEDRTQRALQYLNVAILFSRRAKREMDIRFLNAALKLNDWAIYADFPQAGSVVDARLLLSVAEQESTFSEFG